LTDAGFLCILGGMLFLLVFYVGLFLVLGFACAMTRTHPQEFFVSRRAGSVPNVSLSLLSTILGSSAILGTISLSEKIGWAAAWMMISASAGLLALMPLAKYVRRYGQFTLPDLLETFYGPHMKRIACVMIPIAWTGVIAAQIIGSARILSFVTPLSYSAAALLATVLFSTYTLLGGQTAILKTDKWQGLLMAAALITAMTAAIRHSGRPAWHEIAVTFPFHAGFTPLQLLILLLTYASTFLVGPDIYSRLFCARDERTATRSVLVTAAVLAPMGFFLAWIGITGHAESFDFLQTPLVSAIVALGLFSAVLSSADTTLLTASTTFSELFLDLNNRHALTLTRISIGLFAALSLLVALTVPNIIQSLLLAFSIFSGAFLLPTLMGLKQWPCARSAARAAALAGGLLALTGKILDLHACPTGNLLILYAFIINALILWIGYKKARAS